MIVTKITISVSLTVKFGVGQTTFDNSTLTSLKKSITLRTGFIPTSVPYCTFGIQRLY